MRNTEAQETYKVLNELRGELHEVVILLSTIARHIDDFRYETHRLNRYLRSIPREEQSEAQAAQAARAAQADRAAQAAQADQAAQAAQADREI